MKLFKSVAILSLTLSSLSSYAETNPRKSMSEQIIENYISNVRVRIDFLNSGEFCIQGLHMSENVKDIESAHSQISSEGAYYPTAETEKSFASVDPRIHPELPDFLRENLDYKLALYRTLENINFEATDIYEQMNKEVLDLLTHTKFFTDWGNEDLPAQIQFLEDGKLEFGHVMAPEIETGTYSARYVKPDGQERINIEIKASIRGEVKVFHLISRKTYYYRTEVVLVPENNKEVTYTNFISECSEG